MMHTSTSDPHQVELSSVSVRRALILSARRSANGHCSPRGPPSLTPPLWTPLASKQIPTGESRQKTQRERPTSYWRRLLLRPQAASYLLPSHPPARIRRKQNTDKSAERIRTAVKITPHSATEEFPRLWGQSPVGETVGIA